ncbi:hypothetical protein M2101_001321 [Parabacteroides sp. PM5-20]|uniref:RagB/SusD family nutrient uptake outer membrane protein n=1 Tax=Parabacteroides sp. PM5-20 TaxID=2940527 RepID=UPI00247410E5|nr:RagB/SusD family nutrient uptake outer membrane protein [Parabacteroides sp. PM5-20]MDH6534645.1 hypothetical protein [Parabacteroides sp. PM5-20]
MKKIIYISVLCSAMILSGCDDLLDVTPGSELTDDGFWKSEADLKGACNMLYYNLAGWSNDARADEIIGTGSNGTSNGTRSIPGTSSDWTDPYKYIYRANNIIEKADESPLAENVRNRWRAEAFFFRAYHHFSLVKKYGDVPLITKTFSSVYDEDLKMGRTPRETVIQQCYQDLEFAIANLPAHSALPTSEFDRRRVSRSSALGMIVRIGLHEGTFQKYHGINGGANANGHLDKAIAAFERLRNEGHDLFPDFNKVFSYENEANSVNKEIVFGKAYGENDFTTVTTGHVHTRNQEGSYGLTRNILDQFLYADGLPIEKTALKVPVETSFNNILGLDHEGNELPNKLGQRDPRLKKTIWYVNDPLQDDAFMGWVKTGKGTYYPFDSQRPKAYQSKKAFFGSLWEKSSGNKDFTDKIIIRYAEMLIAYAEALYERNGSISDAQLDETVNRLRARVGFEVKLTNAFVAQNGLNMRDEIRRERTVELLTEGFRYDDIIRWKIAEKVLPVDMVGPICLANELQNPSLHSDFTARLTDASGNINGTFVYNQPSTYVIEFKGTRSFNPQRDYYYPIPTFEIAQSDFNIVQNPGWE